MDTSCRRRPRLPAILPAVILLLFACSWRGNDVHDIASAKALPDQGDGDLQSVRRAAAALHRAEDVLANSALTSFEKELPHEWQRASDLLLKPLSRVLPVSAKLSGLIVSKQRIAMQSSGMINVSKDASSSLHRKWLAWLEEACRILGLEAPTGSSNDEQPWGICPELWVDEVWPSSAVTPVGKRLAPVWSVPAPAGAGQGILVMQARLLKEFPVREVKALIGFELGRTLFARLPQLMPPFAKYILQAMLAARTYRIWHDAQTPSPVLAGAPRWVRGFLTSKSWTPSPSRLTAPSEFVALGAMLQRLVPLPLQPFVFGGLVSHGREIGQRLRSRRSKSLFGGSRRRSARPISELAREAKLIALARLLLGSQNRALVITLDRVAALVSGDAKSAAAALLRVKGKLPRDADRRPELLEECLQGVAANAATRVWPIRKEALLRNPHEPPAEVRVQELLAWSETEASQRLIALGQVRRTRQRRMSWVKALREYQRQKAGSLNNLRPQLLWHPWLGYYFLGILSLLPFSCMDGVRWASCCTLSLATLGITFPLLGTSASPALPSVPGMGLAAALVLYALIEGSIWWNHLMGGARKWALLSSQLVSQLMEQADTAVGIAYLTRDWAEMARRSLAALDQELCGSWRTSLHELASKLADLRQKIEEPPQAVTNSGAKQLSLSNGSSPGEQPQRQQLAAWAGSLEAAVSRPTSREPLWLKVDRVVQKAARVESARMACALEASDPDQLRAMMTWWMAKDSSTAASGGIATARLLQEAENNEVGESETLAGLLFSERLHQRFPYPSFYGNDVCPPSTSVSEAVTCSGEFKQLEAALQRNLKALQELRDKLAPFEESSRAALSWSWHDVLAVAARFREALRWPAKAKRAAAAAAGAAAVAATSGTVGLSGHGVGLEVIDASDQLAEFTTMSGLFLGTLGGLLGSLAMAIAWRWGWAVGMLDFAVANAVLLLNYSRLHLPHVRRRLEQRLGQLKEQREGLMNDILAAQQASHQTGLIHIRAHIFLQSVNVIRNLHYLVMCVKTEMQCIGAEDGKLGQQQLLQQQRTATSGMQLLLALLPHGTPKWQQEALAVEDTAKLRDMLLGRRRKVDLESLLAPASPEARKRLWLLFRMVHLSSAIPCELQGQLGALAERYLRPVLVERRVPLANCQAIESQADSGHVMLQNGRGNNSQQPQVGQTTSFEDDDEEQGDFGATRLPSRSVSQQSKVPSDAGSVGSDEKLSFCASSVSNASRASRRSDRPGDTSKALRKLIATRSDLAKVLARLPAASLLSQPAATSAEGQVLSDISSSIIFSVPCHCLDDSSSSEECVVGIGAGFRYGAKPFTLNRVQTSLQFVCVVASQPGIPRTSGNGAIQEFCVQLCDLADDEPSPLAVTSAWTSLAAAEPSQFNDVSLRSRRHKLRRAKDAIRSKSASS